MAYEFEVVATICLTNVHNEEAPCYLTFVISYIATHSLMSSQATL